MSSPPSAPFSHLERVNSIEKLHNAIQLYGFGIVDDAEEAKQQWVEYLHCCGEKAREAPAAPCSAEAPAPIEAQMQYQSSDEEVICLRKELRERTETAYDLLWLNSGAMEHLTEALDRIDSLEEALGQSQAMLAKCHGGLERTQASINDHKQRQEKLCEEKENLMVMVSEEQCRRHELENENAVLRNSLRLEQELKSKLAEALVTGDTIMLLNRLCSN
ncbi:hypothetical protein VNI00_017490 [Paramarasmius palmivorus]|uniref:Uncharacterized protein n=1 Tax=Paramarasmius palmivorus TaxID=297713 RepID=A0AAW0B505_9AGAR